MENFDSNRMSNNNSSDRVPALRAVDSVDSSIESEDNSNSSIKSRENEENEEYHSIQDADNTVILPGERSPSPRLNVQEQPIEIRKQDSLLLPMENP